VDVIELATARPGQTQEGRLPPELRPGFVRIEERPGRKLLAYVRSVASLVPFFRETADEPEPDGDWSPFVDAPLPGRDGLAPPHFALLAAFLKLYRVPRCAINAFTARHLEFFYRRVLGFDKLPPKPDRAHLLVELKKGARPVGLGPQHAFSAGKDTAGAEILYAPVDTTVLRHARVERLASVYVDPADGASVCFAPDAASADGLGAGFESEAPRWPPFGMPRLPVIPRAPIGFAVASPVLRMKEGTRVVTLTLRLAAPADAAVTPQLLKDRLECFVTGEKGWLGPYDIDAQFTPDPLTLKITCSVPAADAAVADYDPQKHRHAFTARAPVMQVLLKEDPPHRYAVLRSLQLDTVTLRVEASGLRSLQLESDTGPLDPKRAFQPFGAQPVAGSRFMVGCPEALAKRLESLTLELHWLGLPGDFFTHYDGYPSRPAATAFSVKAALRDGAGREAASGTACALFSDPPGELSSLVLKPGEAGATASTPPAPQALRMKAYAAGGTLWMQRATARELLKRPLFGTQIAAPQAREGFVTLKLQRDFQHAAYRRKLIEQKAVNEPYTPTLGAITLSYVSQTQPARIASEREEDFAAAEADFFHVGAFGQRREHRYLRTQFPFATRNVHLLPEYEDEGELLIGLAGVEAGQGASLLVKVAEGSADPEADAQPVSWSVLCNNYWRPLCGLGEVRDGTNNLLATGLVGITVPLEASTVNTFLPAGLLWLKAAVHEKVEAACALVGVAANAIEVRRRPGGEVAARLWTPLPAGSIARLKTPVAAVKAAAQPFATFGGSALECDAAFNTRVAERLRHRNRAITAWDYERAVLAQFPELHKVKCIPHSRPAGSWQSPGHVLIVVVPDQRRRSAVDPLRPRADSGTLRDIEEHLAKRVPMSITVHARNPRYQAIRLDFKAKFRPEFEFGYYSEKLNDELIAYLSPWAADPGAALSFGGVAYKSALLDFVEERDYVDYVTDFRMYDLRGGPWDGSDVNEARAAAPDAILVSDTAHTIAEAP